MAVRTTEQPAAYKVIRQIFEIEQLSHLKIEAVSDGPDRLPGLDAAGAEGQLLHLLHEVLLLQAVNLLQHACQPLPRGRTMSRQAFD